ncbi:MAG: YggS family pyridoxal phosphate-dependent enzyme [Candidatus Omnitrophica bacterium]|jgi:pyridoxal phosphate enzyme (YggS family)|nr:YggS family pyridoxal phosphate-dependent enzyme [Candidatus Omnitrophota bacterium]
MSIAENIEKILSEVPEGITVVAAAKTRTIEEIQQAISAGIKIIGENYVNEAIEKFRIFGKTVEWHLIGHLQTNKIKQAIDIFDMIETLDSLKLADKLNKEMEKLKRKMPVLIEINSGQEENKNGILPEDIEEFMGKISCFEYVEVLGLMTMGPAVKNLEDIRPFFRLTREILEKISRKNPPNIKMKYLSMGMSDTYKIAIEEGANIIRIGSLIFGPRRE